MWDTSKVHAIARRNSIQQLVGGLKPVQDADKAPIEPITTSDKTSDTPTSSGGTQGSGSTGSGSTETTST